MHTLTYIAICVATTGGVLAWGIPTEASMISFAVLAVATIGVPHGGLDHWTGRRLLIRKLGRFWCFVFFPAYLLIASAVATGWILAPTTVIILFFLVSAWHFGREDQRANDRLESNLSRNEFVDCATSIALGGLVIWVPALARPDELRGLLTLIVPASASDSVNQIVIATRGMAFVSVPLASFIAIRQLVASRGNVVCWVPLVTTAVAIYLPILFSFSLFFCGWHSWQGLQRLRRSEELSVSEFVRCVVPLSVAAIVGVVAIGWWCREWVADFYVGEQTSESLRTLLIGLSAIAVPHILLHEVYSLTTEPGSKREVSA